MIRTIGEKVPNAKLTADDVRLVKALRREGLTQAAVAEKFDVSRACISEIDTGRNWAHIQ